MIAFRSGSPRGSTATVPIICPLNASAAIRPGSTAEVWSSRRVASHSARHQSAGCCSAQPACAETVLYSAKAVATSEPFSSYSVALSPVVPTSCARTYDTELLHSAAEKARHQALLEHGGHDHHWRDGDHRDGTDVPPVRALLALLDGDHDGQRGGLVGRQHDREEELVPNEREREKRGRDQAWKGERKRQAQERAEAALPVDVGRLLQLAWDLAEVALHEPRGQRDGERGVDDHHPGQRVQQVQVLVDDEEREHNDHRWHDALRDDPERDVVVAHESGLDRKT